MAIDTMNYMPRHPLSWAAPPAWGRASARARVCATPSAGDHRPLGGFRTTDIDIHAREILRMRETSTGCWREHTGHRKVAQDTERDNFMTAEMAQAYGLVDRFSPPAVTSSPKSRIGREMPLPDERCSFCGKTETQANQLVSGRTACTSGECIATATK